MTVKLIALDIDETLLNDAGELTSMTMRTIQKAKKAGIKIVLTTGRPLSGTLVLLKKLGLNDSDDQYVINLHGASIQTTNGRVLAKNPVRFADFLNLQKEFKNTKYLNILALTANQIFSSDCNLNYYTAVEAAKNRLNIRIEDSTRFQKDRTSLTFYKLMLSGKKSLLDQLTRQLKNSLPSHLRYIRTEACFLDILERQVNKGWAVRKLAERLSLTPDQVMAIGDGDSDASMVKYAKYGVAMKNGTDKLLRSTDLVTDDNNNDGVGKAIQKYVEM